MRTTIRIKPELARRAKAYAHETNRTFTELVEDVLTDLLDWSSLSPSKLPELTVVGGDEVITTEALEKAIKQMDLEDGLRRLGMKIDPAA
jgi:hypothetical protein